MVKGGAGDGAGAGVAASEDARAALPSASDFKRYRRCMFLSSSLSPVPYSLFSVPCPMDATPILPQCQLQHRPRARADLGDVAFLRCTLTPRHYEGVK